MEDLRDLKDFDDTRCKTGQASWSEKLVVISTLYKIGGKGPAAGAFNKKTAKVYLTECPYHRMSTPPQNCQLIVYYYHLRYEVYSFVGKLTFKRFSTLYRIGGKGPAAGAFNKKTAKVRPSFIWHNVFIN